MFLCLFKVKQRLCCDISCFASWWLAPPTLNIESSEALLNPFKSGMTLWYRLGTCSTHAYFTEKKYLRDVAGKPQLRSPAYLLPFLTDLVCLPSKALLCDKGG